MRTFGRATGNPAVCFQRCAVGFTTSASGSPSSSHHSPCHVLKKKSELLSNLLSHDPLSAYLAFRPVYVGFPVSSCFLYCDSSRSYLVFLFTLWRNTPRGRLSLLYDSDACCITPT